MKIKVHASYGFACSDIEDIIEIDDAELEGKTEEEIEKIKDEVAWDFAVERVDFWHEDDEVAWDFAVERVDFWHEDVEDTPDE